MQTDALQEIGSKMGQINLTPGASRVIAQQDLPRGVVFPKKSTLQSSLVSWDELPSHQVAQKQVDLFFNRC